jgi:hypothetical protein
MRKHIWKPTLAMGVLLVLSGLANAGDRDTQLLAGGSTTTGSTTMTLGGQGTAAQAATEDTELTGHYGGYRGWGGGYGYRGYYGGYRGGYYGGYRGYYGGYRGYSYYRPYYTGYYGYRPYYYPRYYPAYYGGYYGYNPYYYGPSFGIYVGISGDATSSAPTVNLGNSFAPPAPMVQPDVPNDGTFPYDGGPVNPVPLPKADQQSIPPANPIQTAPISGKTQPGIKPATTPYKYKAYGEK